MRLTPWYPGDVKPVREGVYERRRIGVGTPYYSYWNGRWWGLLCITPTTARHNSRHTSIVQNREWRGVKK